MNGICQLAAKWSLSANAFIMLTSVLEIGSRTWPAQHVWASGSTCGGDTFIWANTCL